MQKDWQADIKYHNTTNVMRSLNVVMGRLPPPQAQCLRHSNNYSTCISVQPYNVNGMDIGGRNNGWAPCSYATAWNPHTPPTDAVGVREYFPLPTHLVLKRATLSLLGTTSYFSVSPTCPTRTLKLCMFSMTPLSILVSPWKFRRTFWKSHQERCFTQQLWQQRRTRVRRGVFSSSISFKGDW